MLQKHQIAKKPPEGCKVSVQIKDKYIIKNVICDNNDYEKLAYIIHAAMHICSKENINKIMVNLNMKKELKILDLNYLLSGKSYVNNTRVAYVYNNLADYVDSALISIMKQNNNCNLFNNTNDAEKWLINED